MVARGFTKQTKQRMKSECLFWLECAFPHIAMFVDLRTMMDNERYTEMLLESTCFRGMGEVRLFFLQYQKRDHKFSHIRF